MKTIQSGHEIISLFNFDATGSLKRPLLGREKTLYKTGRSLLNGIGAILGVIALSLLLYGALDLFQNFLDRVTSPVATPTTAASQFD